MGQQTNQQAYFVYADQVILWNSSNAVQGSAIILKGTNR
jgi:hypothetical protein